MQEMAVFGTTPVAGSDLVLLARVEAPNPQIAVERAIVNYQGHHTFDDEYMVLTDLEKPMTEVRL